VELKKQPAATWVALGVSLEASGKKPQAVEAYRRSLAAAPSNQETRSYAEMRIRALR
jgi:predicted TPR repeat methyltransferase